MDIERLEDLKWYVEDEVYTQDVQADILALLDEAIVRQSVKSDIGETSDGYHTFNELYEHRTALFATLCNMRSDISWKSMKHADGTMYEGMFIAGIETPEGQYTYHCEMKYWYMFAMTKEIDKAPAYDGHQPSDYPRLLALSENSLYHQSVKSEDVAISKTEERTVKVNLDNVCSVILTQYGAEILNESNKKLEQQCPVLKLSRYQAGERYEVRLWQMIQDFGHYMGMECVLPIEMVIELEVGE